MIAVWSFLCCPLQQNERAVLTNYTFSLDVQKRNELAPQRDRAYRMQVFTFR